MDERLRVGVPERADARNARANRLFRLFPRGGVERRPVRRCGVPPRPVVTGAVGGRTPDHRHRNHAGDPRTSHLRYLTTRTKGPFTQFRSVNSICGAQETPCDRSREMKPKFHSLVL